MRGSESRRDGGKARKLKRRGFRDREGYRGKLREKNSGRKRMTRADGRTEDRSEGTKAERAEGYDYVRPKQAAEMR